MLLCICGKPQKGCVTVQEKENILWSLYSIIADVNVAEITDQISRDNLSNWCNSWRIAAKEIGMEIGKQFRGE